MHGFENKMLKNKGFNNKTKKITINSSCCAKYNKSNKIRMSNKKSHAKSNIMIKKEKAQLKKNIEYNIDNINVSDYDIIIIGSGLYGLLLANLLSTHKKVLILEAGDFNLLFHKCEENINFTYPENENKFWFCPYKKYDNSLNVSETPLPYAIGGRSVYWGGWCNFPTKDNLLNLDNEFIANLHKYENETRKVLNMVTLNKPKWLENISHVHNVEVSLINGYPLCQIEKTLKNKNIKILANTKVLEIILKNNRNAIGLETTNGHLSINNVPLILSAGTFENTKLLMRLSLSNEIKFKNLGKNLQDHNLTIYVVRFPKKDNKNIDIGHFLLKPYYFSYIQCRYCDNYSDDGYIYLVMKSFISLNRKSPLRNLIYSKKIKNQNEDYKMVLNFSLSKRDVKRWDVTDKYMYNFLKNFNNVEIIDTKNNNIPITVNFTEEQFEFLKKNREMQLKKSYHECGTTAYNDVVDIHSKVKKIDNLFIVGPSVIPSIDGCSPCVFTTTMLLKLKDYLLQVY